MPMRPTRKNAAARDDTTPEREAPIVGAEPVTSGAAFDTPLAPHDDDSLVEKLPVGMYETPVIMERPENEATATVGQRDALLNMGCPIEEIDLATTYDAIDDLFEKYGNRPTTGQLTSFADVTMTACHKKGTGQHGACFLEWFNCKTGPISSRSRMRKQSEVAFSPRFRLAFSG